MNLRQFYKNISIHACSGSWREIIRDFSLEQCKIAYCQNTNQLRVSNWFLQDGKRSSEDLSSVNAKKLAEKYSLKNFTSYDFFGTERKVEFVIQSAKMKNNHKTKRIDIKQKNKKTLDNYFRRV